MHSPQIAFAETLPQIDDMGNTQFYPQPLRIFPPDDIACQAGRINGRPPVIRRELAGQLYPPLSNDGLPSYSRRKRKPALT